jgi:hypothetical protein
MKLWKDFRTNMMYWRFRHITRNRLRLKNWWARRRTSGHRSTLGAPNYSRPFERGLAAHVYRSSQRRSLTAFAALVILLTALSALALRVYISPGLVYLLGSLIIVGCIYYALRGV